MTETRREIARIVEHHLDEILDRTIAAYREEIPSLRGADDNALERVRESTRRATLGFLALYADPDSPARLILNEARRATVDRAGETYDRDEIVAMIRIGRQVVFHSAREFVAQELGHDAAREEDVRTSLEAFLNELERAEQLIPPADDAVHHLLANAEAEEPDLG